MDVSGDYSVISLIKDISEKVFYGQTHVDVGLNKLTVLVPIENNQRITLKFYECFIGNPILILNMPETFPGGKGERFYQWLMLFLQWKYKRKLPEPREYNYRGYFFCDWQPDSFYPMVVYLWNNKGITESMVRQLILGVDKKEVD
jgi:hypothetical protein